MRGIPVMVEPGGCILAALGYKILRFENFEDDRGEVVATFSPGIKKSALAATPIGCRVSREGIHRLYSTPTGNWVAIANGAILFKAAGEDTFELACDTFRGSRPLYIGRDEETGWWYFGEYFGNPGRDEVHVYGSPDGKDWAITYTFPAGSIRHVHNIVYDKFRKGLWVLTGDENEESALYFTEDGFRTTRRAFGGSQAFRAVDILVEESGLIVPSDTPNEKNAIRFLDLATGSMSDRVSLESSAFHCFQSEKWKIVSLVGEPSKINQSDSAHLHAKRARENDWEKIDSYVQDSLSGLSQRLFRYPEIVPVAWLGDDILLAQGIGLTICGFGAVKIRIGEQRDQSGPQRSSSGQSNIS